MKGTITGTEILMSTQVEINNFIMLDCQLYQRRINSFSGFFTLNHFKWQERFSLLAPAMFIADFLTDTLLI